MRAVLLTGGIYHDFGAMSAATAGMLATAGLAVEIVRTPGALVAALSRAPADLLVVQALHWRMRGDDKYAPFRDEWAYETGGDLIAAVGAHAARAGVLALHTGCLCFDDWDGWPAILGGSWVWGRSFHTPGLEAVRVTPSADHPAVAGLAPFTVTDEHYRDLALRPGATVLAQGEAAGVAHPVAHPVAWAREGGGFAGRAVTLTTGHDLASLTEPGQARLIRRAALWAVERDGEGRA